MRWQQAGDSWTTIPPLDSTQVRCSLKLETLSLAAVGLLTTKLAAGLLDTRWWSWSPVKFAPPIAIGFGFSIDGVGGLLGVNRTVALDPLRDGLQAGSLDTVLFPADVAKTLRR